jgi:hypothetical protein
MSLASDSIWFLICKKNVKKKRGTGRGQAQLLFLAVKGSPARNFNSHCSNFLKVINKGDAFVVLISMLHEYVLFSNVVMYVNPTVNYVYVNISLTSFLLKMEMSYDCSFSFQYSQESETE